MTPRPDSAETADQLNNKRTEPPELEFSINKFNGLNLTVRPNVPPLNKTLILSLALTVCANVAFAAFQAGLYAYLVNNGLALVIVLLLVIRSQNDSQDSNKAPPV